MAAPPAVRMTVMYASDGVGWSETYWQLFDNIAAAVPRVNQFLAARVKILSILTGITGVRLSVEGQSRFGRLFLPGSNSLQPGATPTLDVPPAGNLPPGFAFAPTQVCMNLEVVVGNLRVGTRYFTQIPTASVGTDYESLIAGTPQQWWNDFNAWIGVVRNNSWNLKLTGSQNLGVEKPISGWRRSAGAGTNLTLVLVPGATLGVAEGDKVVVRHARMRFSGLRSPNGTWKVDAVAIEAGTNNQLITLRGTSAIDPTLISVDGLARAAAVFYLPISNLRPLRVRIHKRGGPFLRTVGRRSTRKFAV